MSSEALGWAFKQLDLPSSRKFTLVALCECAHYKTGRIYPSIDHLCEITGLNRKTVISNIAALEKDGYILDTGERRGHTRQIKVYAAAIGTVPKTEQSQKRNSTENGTVPETAANSPKNGSKESQKRDTEPSREPSKNLLPQPPASRGRKIRVSISDDWKAPLIAELPPAAQAFALGWPDGAYAAQAEAFIQFHRGTGGRRADWDALWAAWVSKNHEVVMRGVKAGIAYAAPSQPRGASPSTSGGGGARAKEPTAAKSREDARSSEIHDALRKAVGQTMWADWWESAAIILIDDVLTVVAPSAFHRSWLEDHHEDALRLAVEQVGFAVEIIRWEVAAPAKKQKGKSK